MLMKVRTHEIDNNVSYEEIFNHGKRRLMLLDYDNLKQADIKTIKIIRLSELNSKHLLKQLFVTK